MSTKTITRKGALELFFASQHGAPVDIIYAHYNKTTRRSRGTVEVRGVRCIPKGSGARGRLLCYRDPSNHLPRYFYEACWLYINHLKIDFKTLRTP